MKDKPTPTEIMQAHQYLYYVTSNPIWGDYAYDKFCQRHGLDGNGGSDRAADYPAKVVKLAEQMRAEPGAFPPDAL